MQNKLKYKEVKDYREQLLEEQNYTCKLCNLPLDKDEAVLDHCHIHGNVRSVLHRGCNAFLGKLENSRTINKITDEKLVNILANMFDYMTDYKDAIHPTHGKKKKRMSTKKK